jgi:prepilin-type N-terminal cleavage/methylation domain-containing protein
MMTLSGLGAWRLGLRTRRRGAWSGPARCPGERGLTLIELMISLVISSIAISAALAMGYSMINAYHDHRRMLLAQRSARVSLEILADATRVSNPAVPQGNIEDLVGCTMTAGLRVVNSTTGPDRLELIHASGGVLTSLRTVWNTTQTTMTVLDASQLAIGDTIVVTNLDQAELIEITGITPQVNDYLVTTGQPSLLCGGAPLFPGAGYAAGSLVIRAKISHFFVLADATVGFVPTLMLDPDGGGADTPEPIAEGVEDLQVAVGTDVNSDGTVAEDGSPADEWFRNVNAVGETDAPAMTVKPPRAIRITLVARSVEEGSATPSYFRPAVEDHAGSATPDVYRRRVLTTTVEIRNLAGSP